MATLDRIPASVIRKVPIFEANASITKVLPAVYNNQAVLINKDGNFYGIIDFRSVHRESRSLRINKSAQALNYAVKVPKIMRTTSLDDAIFYFYRTKRNALPYFEDDKAIGVLDRFTLMKMLLSLDMLKGYECKDIMTTPALAIDSEASVAQANSAMGDRNVNRMLVLDKGKIAGLVTKHDLITNFTTIDQRKPEMETTHYSPSRMKVSDVMKKNPYTIDANDDIKSALRDMVNKSISSLVVVKNGEPSGILTISDILASFIAKRESYENKIVISGIDRSTYEYEYDIKEQANAFIEKAQKFRKVKIEYIAVNIKNLKNNRYEVRARAKIEKYRTLEVRASDFGLDKTFTSVLEKLMETIKKKNEKSEQKGYERIESE